MILKWFKPIAKHDEDDHEKTMETYKAQIDEKRAEALKNKKHLDELHKYMLDKLTDPDKWLMK